MSAAIAHRVGRTGGPPVRPTRTRPLRTTPSTGGRRSQCSEVPSARVRDEQLVHELRQLQHRPRQLENSCQASGTQARVAQSVERQTLIISTAAIKRGIYPGHLVVEGSSPSLGASCASWVLLLARFGVREMSEMARHDLRCLMNDTSRRAPQFMPRALARARGGMCGPFAAIGGEGGRARLARSHRRARSRGDFCCDCLSCAERLCVPDGQVNRRC